MPSVAFLPWATTEARLRFGAFHIVPLAAAQAVGQIASQIEAAITAILESYRRQRAANRASVPLLRRDELSLTVEMSDDVAAMHFDFRLRLAFSALAARQYFGVRYRNADSVRPSARRPGVSTPCGQARRGVR